MFIQSVFEYQMPIPAKYTCEGQNLSPPLTFGIPTGTKTLVLIVDDPDAPKGTFTHWTVWNIPPEVQSLSEGAKELFTKGSTVKQGINDFGQTRYGGPCPPPGKPHRYFFKLYALDAPIDLKEGANKQEVEKAMKGHIIDKAQLVGTYQRSK